MLHVPTGVVAQVWRNGARQVRLISSGALQDLDEAKVIGVVCGSAGVGDAIDAGIALVARRHCALVVTSDPDDIARFGTDVECVVC